MVKMTTAKVEPIQANGEPERLIQPKWAAQATTAGPVPDRRPVTTPIPNVSNSTNPELMKFLHHNGRFTCEGRPRAGGMDDRSAGEIQIWRAHLSTDGSDVSWPGGRTEGVLVGPCHSRKSQSRYVQSFAHLPL